ncbi:MAG: Hsp20/alpha crystallin family protein [Lentisphaeria bacterium]
MIWQTVQPLTTWNPVHDLENLSKQFERLFGGEINMNKNNDNDSATTENTERTLPVYNPRVSLWENEAAVFLTVEMPGVNEKGVNIDLQSNTLALTGIMETQLPEGFATENQTPLKRKYERQFNLGEGLDHDQIKAAMKDGILRLTLPKIKTTATRRIEVQAD